MVAWRKLTTWRQADLHADPGLNTSHPCDPGQVPSLPNIPFLQLYRGSKNVYLKAMETAWERSLAQFSRSRCSGSHRWWRWCWWWWWFLAKLGLSPGSPHHPSPPPPPGLFPPSLCALLLGQLWAPADPKSCIQQLGWGIESWVKKMPVSALAPSVTSQTDTIAALNSVTAPVSGLCVLNNVPLV